MAESSRSSTSSSPGVARAGGRSVDFEKENPIIADVGDEEDKSGYNGTQEEEESKDYGPIKAEKESSRPVTLHPNALQQVYSHRSYAAGDGYTCFSEDEERPNIPSGDTAADAEKQFEVTWDGDDDPMNPRSMPKLRRWLIVLVVSASSVCV